MRCKYTNPISQICVIFLPIISLLIFFSIFIYLFIHFDLVIFMFSFVEPAAPQRRQVAGEGTGRRGGGVPACGVGGRCGAEACQGARHPAGARGEGRWLEHEFIGDWC